jgi:hypothetical protein
MSGTAAIVGVGHTRYGRLPEFDAYELGLWALKNALADAGLRFEESPDRGRLDDVLQAAASADPGSLNITPGQGASPASTSRPQPRRSVTGSPRPRAGLRQQWPLGRRSLWRRRRHLWQRRRRNWFPYGMTRWRSVADGAPPHGALRTLPDSSARFRKRSAIMQRSIRRP